MKPIKLSPSGAHVWTRCLSSASVLNAANPYEERPYAERGTLIHKIAAQAVIDKYDLPQQDLELNVTEVQQYHDEKETIDDMVSFYMNHILYLMNILTEARIHVEQKQDGVLIHHEEQDYLTAGTPDVYITHVESHAGSHAGISIIVVDLKTGAEPIEAKGNLQLMVYAHMIAKKFIVFGEPTTLKGVIIQPSLQSIREAEYFYQEDFFAKLLPKPGFNVGPQCYMCFARPTCPTFKTALGKYMNPTYSDVTVDRSATYSELLDVASAGIKHFTGIKTDALAIMRLGAKIDGWEVGKRATPRTWKKGVDEAQLATLTGLNPSLLIEKKVLSPAKIEKLTKADLGDLTFSFDAPSLKRVKHGESDFYEM